MNCCRKCLLVSLILLVAIFGFIHYKLTYIPPLPEINLDTWWGPGLPKKLDTSIKPFTVQFTDEMINDLKLRLSLESTTPPLEETNFEYGFNTNYLKEVTQFWSKDYNFKERETFLNQFPHFKTNIQGLDIHYIHVKPKISKDIKVVPLLLVHGWPGSVREFYETIPLLTTPRKDQDFVFEVIVPSLPGYGFSQAATKPGFGADQIAIIFRNLMHRIGHTKYYTQGGDWGSEIAQIMAIFFPKEVLGIHLNFIYIKTDQAMLTWILSSIYPRLVVDDKYKERMYPLADKLEFSLKEFGYAHIQATKPDTVGVALTNSPSGLAAYILEKFSVWTNPAFKQLSDGGMTRKFSLTNLLDNVMIYWSTKSITTSMRLYSETLNKRFEDLNLKRQPILVPAANACFRYELIYLSEPIIRQKYLNLVQMTHYEDGGHFAAFEMPQVLADDVWTFVSKVLKAKRMKNEDKKEL